MQSVERAGTSFYYYKMSIVGGRSSSDKTGSSNWPEVNRALKDRPLGCADYECAVANSRAIRWSAGHLLTSHTPPRR